MNSTTLMSLLLPFALESASNHPPSPYTHNHKIKLQCNQSCLEIQERISPILCHLESKKNERVQFSFAFESLLLLLFFNLFHRCCHPFSFSFLLLLFHGS